MSRASVLTLVVALFALAVPAFAQQYNLVGCYSGSGSLSNEGTQPFMSSKACFETCQGLSMVVFATTDSDGCYCGSSLPAVSVKTDTSSCNLNCSGYPLEMCGGLTSFSFYVVDSPAGASILAAASSAPASQPASSASEPPSTLSTSTAATHTSSPPTSASQSSSSSTATSDSSDSSSSPGSTHAANTPSSSSSPSTSSSPTSADQSSTSGKPTVSATPNPTKKSSKISSGAIAGIVVGVLAALAILAGIVYFLKRRRDSTAFYSPSATPNGFKEPFGVHPLDTAPGGGLPPPNSSPFNNGIDQRLNPVMLGERRISVGSLADARDYSRKILRVANPDD